MSMIKKLIVNADAESRYLTPGEMNQPKSFMTSGDRHLRLVKTLTESRDRVASKPPIGYSKNDLIWFRPGTVFGYQDNIRGST